MRPRITLALGFAITLAGLAAPVSAQDGYSHGRLRYVDQGVTLQRATDAGAEEALGNEPFLPGDRVWTDAGGRAEFQFPDGSSVRLDRRSKLDYTGHDEGGEERINLRLWSGGLIVHTRGRGSARLEVETPAGTVAALERSVVRIDVDSGEARVSVYDGEATLDDGQQRVRLTAGERTFARWGGGAEDPERFDAGESDDFASWDEQREVEVRVAAADSRYLPDELEPYAEELERNGDWRYESTVGYVWVPQVEVGWRPYSNGRWTWTPYGWTWVPYERWGWAPSHYGRWDHASFGWYWVPGRTWGPAWVSWAVGGGYVGWCPLGRHDRPVVGWGDHRGGNDRLDRGRNDVRDRGHAVPRGGFGGPPIEAWNIVRSNELGHRNIARIRLPADRVDATSLRVAESSTLRPSRDGLALRPQSAVPRAVSTKQRPGDFVRELGVDNKTTIPAPWTRGYGPPPAGVEGARYGVPRDRDEGRRENSAASPGSGVPTTSTGANDGQASSAAPRSGRPVPWFRPSGEAQNDSGARPSGAQPANGGQPASVPPFWSPQAPRADSAPADEGRRSRGDEGGRVYRPRQDGAGAGGNRPAAGSEPSSSSGAEGNAARPRGEGRSYGGSEPRSYGGSGSEPRSYAGGDSGSEPRSAQPRSYGGGGEARSSGGSSEPRSHVGGGGGGAVRPSGGEGRSGGGEARPSGGSAAPREHAAPRPQRRN